MTMIKKILLLFTLISFFQINAQILDEYPKNQDFYEGGLSNFYKEINDYLIKNNVSECDSKQIYQLRIIVTKDSGVKIIQDSDTENISNNKCAYDLSMAIIKNLNHWKPAEIKGNRYGAITEFIIYPKDLFKNYKTQYNPENFVINAQYPNGNKAFDKEFHDNFMALFADYHINGVVNIEFYINHEGKIVNPRIYPAIDNRAFNIDFMRTLARLKKVWKPALYSNLPIKQRIAFPVRFSTNFIER